LVSLVLAVTAEAAGVISVCASALEIDTMPIATNMLDVRTHVFMEPPTRPEPGRGGAKRLDI
jgi:hypothetical protein